MTLSDDAYSARPAGAELVGASIGDIAALMKGGGAHCSYSAKTRELAVDTVDYLLGLEDAHAAQAAAEAAAEAEAAAPPAAAQGSTWEVSRGGSQLFGRAGVALYGEGGSSVESVELTVLDEEEETLVDGGSGGSENENDMNESKGERSSQGGALREARRVLSPMLSPRHALSPLSPNSPQKRQSKHFEAAYPRQASSSSSSSSSSSAGVARRRFSSKQSSLLGVSGKARTLIEESASSSNSLNKSREGRGVAEDKVSSASSASSPRFSL